MINYVVLFEASISLLFSIRCIVHDQLHVHLYCLKRPLVAIMGIVHDLPGFSVILFEAFISCNHDKLADSIEFTNAKFLLQTKPANSVGNLPIAPQK